jgi:ATP-dependent Clp protease ATP-binding subunit ClpC
VFERLTDPAREAVVFAEEEAHVLRHKHVGTEHILLGLLRQREGPAARVLASLDVTADVVRAQIEHLVLSGVEIPPQLPFTPRVKEVFELALGEATSLGQDRIGPEHLLLAIARENQGVASRVLDEFDADSRKVRSELMLMLSHGPRPLESRGAQTPVSSGGIEVELSPRARLLLMSAGARALGSGRTQLEPGDLLEAMLADQTIGSLLSGLGVDVPAVRERLQFSGWADADLDGR